MTIDEAAKMLHTYECDSFHIYDYGCRQGKCDCTEDVKKILTWAGRCEAPVFVAEKQSIDDGNGVVDTAPCGRRLPCVEHAGDPL